MEPKTLRKNKRISEITPLRSGFSKILQEANKKIRGEDYTSGLTILNKLAVGEKNSGRLGKILLVTADSESRLGRYRGAADIYAKSMDYFRTPPHPACFNAA